MFDVSWFEARAYSRWLNARLGHVLAKRGLLRNYDVRLPNAIQWQRVARAASLTEADERRWPWHGDGSDIDQRANIHGSVGSATSAGLYPANSMGVYDMAGNVWEWMNHHSEIMSIIFDIPRDEKKVALLSIRGGSWVNPPEHAMCSYSRKSRPARSSDYIGFRLVLAVP